MTTLPKALSIPSTQKNLIPTYAVRFTYPFDNIEAKYANTETPFHLQDQTISLQKYNTFWQQIYQNCSDFSKFKTSNKIPKYANRTAYIIFIIGVVLLIVGCIPIWKDSEGDKTMNLALIIVAGLIIVLSVAEKIIVTCVSKRYREGTLARQYERIIAKAVNDNFSEYLSKGLQWRSGALGFKCIEFWYVFSEERMDGFSRQNTIENSSVFHTDAVFPKGKLDDPSSTALNDSSDYKVLLNQFTPMMPSTLLNKRTSLANNKSRKKKPSISSSNKPLNDSQNSVPSSTFRTSSDLDAKLNVQVEEPLLKISIDKPSLLPDENSSPGNTTGYSSIDSPELKGKVGLLEAPRRVGEVLVKSKLAPSDANDSFNTDSSSPGQSKRRFINSSLPPLKEEMNAKHKKSLFSPTAHLGNSLNLDVSPSGLSGFGSTEIDPTFSIIDPSLNKKGDSIIKLGKAGVDTPKAENLNNSSEDQLIEFPQYTNIPTTIYSAISKEKPEENNGELPKIVIDSNNTRSPMRRPNNRMSVMKQQKDVPSPLREIPQEDEEESELDIEQRKGGLDNSMKKKRKNPHAIMSIEPIVITPHAALEVFSIDDEEISSL